MKLKFKKQEYQTKAVNAVVEAFKGQPKIASKSYRVDPGNIVDNDTLDGLKFEETTGFENAEIANDLNVLSNIQKVQKDQNLPISQNLVSNKISTINLDIEMEIGTGQTYCYIKTMFELNEKYDLVGQIAEPLKLTRNTVGEILQKIEPAIFSQFKQNPEEFISESIRFNKHKVKYDVVKDYDSLMKMVNK